MNVSGRLPEQPGGHFGEDDDRHLRRLPQQRQPHKVLGRQLRRKGKRQKHCLDPPRAVSGHSDIMKLFFYMFKYAFFFKREKPEMDDFEEEKNFGSKEKILQLFLRAP